MEFQQSGSEEDFLEGLTAKPYKHKGRFAQFVERFLRNRLATIGFVVAFLIGCATILAPVIAPYPSLQTDYRNRFAGPCLKHPLGTDNLGRDILSRILFGYRSALLISFVSVAFSLIAGSLIGITSGYYGGRLDDWLMRFLDILMAFPPLLLAIAIIAALGPGTLNLILVISVVYLPIFARLARGEALHLREEVFVKAVRARGASDGRIILRHIIPNSVSPLIIQASLQLGFAILTATALSFLGLGVQPPKPSLGLMLNEGRNFLYHSPWMPIFPGLAIMIAVLSFNTIGDGLRDVFDPRTIQR
jgi:peptide/nickel transport system permease protein